MDTVSVIIRPAVVAARVAGLLIAILGADSDPVTAQQTFGLTSGGAVGLFSVPAARPLPESTWALAFYAENRDRFVQSVARGTGGEFDVTSFTLSACYG